MASLILLTRYILLEYFYQYGEYPVLIFSLGSKDQCSWKSRYLTQRVGNAGPTVRPRTVHCIGKSFSLVLQLDEPVELLASVGAPVDVLNLDCPQVQSLVMASSRSESAGGCVTRSTGCRSGTAESLPWAPNKPPWFSLNVLRKLSTMLGWCCGTVMLGGPSRWR